MTIGFEILASIIAAFRLQFLTGWALNQSVSRWDGTLHAAQEHLWKLKDIETRQNLRLLAQL